MNYIINKKSKEAKLQRHLLYKTSSAIHDYHMIEKNDRVMVCISGGKDSFTMLDLLFAFQRKTSEKFEIVVIHLDQKMPGFPVDIIQNYLSDSGVEFYITEQNIYKTIEEKILLRKPACSLCSRLRRGALYNFAEKNNINKIALGHQMDDIVETFFLNMFYNEKLKAISPKLLSDNKKNIIIRTLSYIKENDIIQYSNLMKFPVITGKFCVIKENKKRKIIKSMLNEWRIKYPGRVEKNFSSLKNVEIPLSWQMIHYMILKNYQYRIKNDFP